MSDPYKLMMGLSSATQELLKVLEEKTRCLILNEEDGIELATNVVRYWCVVDKNREMYDSALREMKVGVTWINGTYIIWPVNGRFTQEGLSILQSMAKEKIGT